MPEKNTTRNEDSWDGDEIESIGAPQGFREESMLFSASGY